METKMFGSNQSVSLADMERVFGKINLTEEITNLLNTYADGVDSIRNGGGIPKAAVVAYKRNVADALGVDMYGTKGNATGDDGRYITEYEMEDFFGEDFDRYADKDIANTYATNLYLKYLGNNVPDEALESGKNAVARSIEEAKEEEMLQRAAEFAERNKKIILYGVGAIALLVLFGKK